MGKIVFFGCGILWAAIGIGRFISEQQADGERALMLAVLFGIAALLSSKEA